MQYAGMSVRGQVEILPPNRGFKGEVQSRITIISKERVKISLQIGANMMKIG